MDVIAALALIAFGGLLGAGVAWLYYLNTAGAREVRLRLELTAAEFTSRALAASAVVPVPSFDPPSAEQEV